jgi:DNA-binding response OmpR family regulator
VNNRPSILLIEDAPETQLLVRAVFGTEIELVTSGTLSEGAAQLNERVFDLVLLDGTLPDGDGFEFFAKLRQNPKFSRLAVIFLTARTAINDRVAAFAMGAEDYVVKPIEVREFRARVEAKLRKLSAGESQSVLEIGTLRIDRHRFRAFRKTASGELSEIILTPYEFKILSALAEKEGNVLSRDSLISTAWGDSVHVLERTVDRHISSLRKKLGSGAEKIEPVHGVGYRLNASSISSKKKAA